MKKLLILTIALLSSSSLFGFSVSPMVAEFDPTAPRAHQNYVLSNTSNEDKPIEVLIGKPSYDEEGRETLHMGIGEENFLVIPQQLVLPANSRRTIKIFYVGDPIEEEDTYRILFKEVPVNLDVSNVERVEDEAGAQMQVIMQYNTRVWITPKGLEGNLNVLGFDREEVPAPVEKIAGQPDSTEHQIPMLNIKMSNTGDRHKYLRFAKIYFHTNDGKKVKMVDSAARKISGHVLRKKEERTFRVAWEDSFPAYDSIKKITVETRNVR